MSRLLHLVLVLLLQSSAVAFAPSFANKNSNNNKNKNSNKNINNNKNNKRATLGPPPLRSNSSPSDDGEPPEPVNDPFKYYGNSNNNATTNVDETTTASPYYTDARVMKKNKKYKSGGFKPAKDNRDNLPFIVQLTTPDPYTNPELKKERARKNTLLDRQKNKGSASNSNNNSNNTSSRGTKSAKYTNLKVGGIAANIFEQDDNTGELLPVLGEFKLDKSTTSGDIVIVGDLTYQVMTARCQYKYVGGQRFDMVRKILEVKPILRVVEEAVLQRSLSKSISATEEPPMLE